MDNESQDERRKKENQLHHPWKNQNFKNKQKINSKQIKLPQNVKRGRGK